MVFGPWNAEWAKRFLALDIMEEGLSPMASFFPMDSLIDNSGQQQQQPAFNINDLDFIMSLQDQQPAQPQPNIQPQPPTIQPGQQLTIDQQFKLAQLQQLQQLQNQIFQEQIALISGSRLFNQSASSNVQDQPPRQSPAPYRGLPTPGSSTEIRASQPVEYVSPMLLDYPNSAPAHIAFNTGPDAMPPSPDIDLDISPLTSPWLGHTQYQQQGPILKSNGNGRKRTASPGTEESRKKQSPAIQPTPMTTTSKRQTAKSNRSRRESTSAMGPPVQDSPSPVDIPPPALDNTQLNPSGQERQQQIKPVTPAMMMNIRGSASLPASPAILAKADVRSRSSNSFSRKGATLKTILPGPMPILPSPTSTSSSSTASNPSTNARTTSNVMNAPLPQIRKTSHKAAEQKRRDSLKSTFDDLRGLLPPIPLATEQDGDPASTPLSLLPARPLLPGALPPRGPPKAGGEGPNKGVSKLQLLMCGNEYIRVLKGRVDRRDHEIVKLRDEVRRLRMMMGDLGLGDSEIDLEKDLDAVEWVGRSNTSGLQVSEGSSNGPMDDDDEDG